MARLPGSRAGPHRPRGTSRAAVASETGLSTTTTSSGLLDEARTRPQVPSSVMTRMPLTVTRSTMRDPAIFSPAAAIALKRCHDPLDDAVFHLIGAMAPTWSASPRSWADRDRDRPSTRPGLRSSMSSTAIAVTTPSS